MYVIDHEYPWMYMPKVGFAKSNYLIFTRDSILPILGLLRNDSMDIYLMLRKEKKDSWSAAQGLNTQAK